MKKILIFAAIGSQNLGDELILKNEVALLREEFGVDCSFQVFSYDKKHPFFCDEHISYHDYFPIGIKQKKNIFKNIASYFGLLKNIAWSDIVVIGGGGIIYDSEVQSTRSPLDLRLYRTKLVRFFRKKLYFYRLGISIQQEANLEKLKKIFKKYYKVTVRDTVSVQILEHIGVTDAELLPDPVFYDNGGLPQQTMCIKKIPSKKFQLNQLPELQLNGKTVGVALRSGYLAESGAMQERMEEGKIRELLQFLERNGAKIILLPHSFHQTDEKANDYQFLNSFATETIEIAETMQEVYEAYKSSELDMCIAMRLHSMVLSEVYEVPYIALSYSTKTQYVMDTVFSKNNLGTA